MSFEDSYFGRLRAAYGKGLLIAAGMRAVIQDSGDRVLLQRRSDLLHWTIIGGIADVGESIIGCLKREINEELGIEPLRFTPFGFASDPNYELCTYANGDSVHGYALLFQITEWKGTLQIADEETTEFRFFRKNDLPPNTRICDRRAIDACERFLATGEFQLI